MTKKQTDVGLCILFVGIVFLYCFEEGKSKMVHSSGFFSHFGKEINKIKKTETKNHKHKISNRELTFQQWEQRLCHGIYGLQLLDYFKSF